MNSLLWFAFALIGLLAMVRIVRGVRAAKRIEVRAPVVEVRQDFREQDPDAIAKLFRRELIEVVDAQGVQRVSELVETHFRMRDEEAAEQEREQEEYPELGGPTYIAHPIAFAPPGDGWRLAFVVGDGPDGMLVGVWTRARTPRDVLRERDDYRTYSTKYAGGGVPPAWEESYPEWLTKKDETPP